MSKRGRVVRPAAVGVTLSCLFPGLMAAAFNPQSAGGAEVTEAEGPIRVVIAGGQAGSGRINTTRPVFRFRVSGAAAEIVCRVDDGPELPCASPFRLPRLGQGRHWFSVTARPIDPDGLPVRVSHRFKVDTWPPGTRMLRGTRGTVRTIRRRAKAVFRVRGLRGSKGLQCRLGGRRWHRCRRWVTRWVGPGRHVIRFRAVDAAGNADPTPIVRRWRVKRWKPGIRGARRYAAGRAGTVSLAVDLGWRVAGVRKGRRARTASTIKAMLMVAYLRRSGVRNRPLDSGERSLLGTMIRHSDNTAASTVRDIVGESAIRRLATRAGMKRFEYSPIWGIMRVNARDHAVFMRRIDRLVPERHRGFALGQLGNITGSQSWGIGQVRHPGWHLYFKGGWGIADGSHGGVVDHQIALLRRGRWRIGLAILTEGNPSVEYGNQTLRGVAVRVLRGLPR